MRPSNPGQCGCESTDYRRSAEPGLNQGVIAELAAKAGLSPQELAQRLAQVLPQAIDKLTPGGVVPKA